jgi:hypothetical protein
MLIIFFAITLSYFRNNEQNHKKILRFGLKKNKTFVPKSVTTDAVGGCEDSPEDDTDCFTSYGSVLTEVQKETWDLEALKGALNAFITECNKQSCVAACQGLIGEKTIEGNIPDFDQEFIQKCNPIPPPTATPAPPPTATPAPAPPPTATPAPPPPPTATPGEGGVPPPTATPGEGGVPPPTATPGEGGVPPPTATPGDQTGTGEESGESNDNTDNGNNGGNGGNGDNDSGDNSNSSFNRYGVSTLLITLSSIIASIQFLLME